MSDLSWMIKRHREPGRFARFDLLVLGCIIWSLSLSRGADFGLFGQHTQARLVLSAKIAKPGETIPAGIHLRMDPGWHTYWVNPGDSGMATKINWALPDGMTAGDIQWPVPETFTAGGLTTYVYEKEVVLLVPLTLARDMKPGRL